MKPSDSLAGGQTLFSLWTSRFASATVLAALALIAAPAAKADVVETFNLSGNFNSFSFALRSRSRDDRSGLQQRLRHGNGAVHKHHCRWARRFQRKPSPSAGVSPGRSSGHRRVQQHRRHAHFGVRHSSAGRLGLASTRARLTGGEVIFGGLTGVLLGADRRRYARPLRPRYTRPTAAHNRPARPAHPCRSGALDLGDDAHRPGGPRPCGEGPARIGLPARQSLSRVPLRGSVGSERASPRDLTTSRAFRYSQGALGSRPSGAAFLFRRPHADLERPVSRDITRS